MAQEINVKIKLEGEKEYKEAINSVKDSIIEFRKEVEQLNMALEKEIELLKKLR